ncbi:MAG: hypothetical protein A2Z99_21355 [Treponema sp. GWB1_62_6]|nr:MAG: hypothetical protein A2Y36_04415 [Treponema sp. GWA1_62_8]OHE63540.1 MAG: hypothetical protein A2Z99_21355 [Treponema sp. GWB1_62_6]OHE63710.1 MAG: hypothetical protein A2001_00610 [Treponema sp. GWC1_61_84]OHE72740.1 MAG: hypothetical protein A2413_20040 [Treponema sp. RIFOXYC1_FULL_61_9]HCM26826.1 hypothetical protein [Treponema sp.]
MVYTPFIWPLIVAAIACVFLALYSGRFPDVPAARPFGAMMWLGVLWTMIYAANLITDIMAIRIPLSNIMYIPTRLMPPAILALALEYTGNERWITRRNAALALAIPVVSIAFSLTSPLHRLFRYDFVMDLSSTMPVLRYRGGLVYQISTQYGNALVLIALGFLATALVRSKLRKENTALIFIGILVPVTINILFGMGITPIAGYSFAPSSIIVTGAAYILALYRFKLFGIAPIARNAVVDSIADLAVVMDNRRHIVDLNHAARRAFGLEAKTALGFGPDKLCPPWSGIFSRFDEIASGSSSLPVETSAGRRDFDLSISKVLDTHGRLLGRLFLLHDVTEKQKTEEKIRRLLAEKDLLLREVHHRIKNNMSVVASMLSLQSHSVSPRSAGETLLEARQRIVSVMILYDKLYRSVDVGALNVCEYLSPLVDSIVANLRGPVPVTVEKDIEDFKLDANTLFALGIIVNELIANSLKHAFTGRLEGRIWVRGALRDGKAVIEIADDGAGFDVGLTAGSQGFGRMLVDLLVQQITGTMKVEGSQGTRYTIEIVPSAYPSQTNLN